MAFERTTVEAVAAGRRGARGRGLVVVATATLCLVGAAACGAPHAGAAPEAPTTWACESGQPASAVVHQYAHASAQEGAEQLPAGGSALLCGSTGYGYRHIQARHQGDWARLASGSDWSDVADRAVAAALGQPERVGFRASNDTFCFSHALGDGNVTMVVVRESDGAIITAYPARHQCDPTG
jgi:hypothetical protein